MHKQQDGHVVSQMMMEPHLQIVDKVEQQQLVVQMVVVLLKPKAEMNVDHLPLVSTVVETLSQTDVVEVVVISGTFVLLWPLPQMHSLLM